MTTEYEILFNKALSILDDNLEIIEGKIIGNRFDTAHKIVSFAQEQVNNLDIPVVVVPKGTLCEHKFKDLTFITDRQIKCKCGKYFSY